jgi:hypothetical protein
MSALGPISDAPRLGQNSRNRSSITYGHLDDDGAFDAIDETLIEQTRHWLQGFPEALKLFNEALEKQRHGVFRRNLLDDLRLAMEKLLQGLFAN